MKINAELVSGYINAILRSSDGFITQGEDVIGRVNDGYLDKVCNWTKKVNLLREANHKDFYSTVNNGMSRNITFFHRDSNGYRNLND